jgi:hypothetical protein
VTTQKLIERLHDFLDLNRRKQKDKREKIRDLLHKLKKRQRELEQEFENAKAEDKRKRIKRDLKVLRAQRSKGIKLCREIKCRK